MSDRADTSLGLGQATQAKFPHGKDGGEHIGSPLGDFQVERGYWAAHWAVRPNEQPD